MACSSVTKYVFVLHNLVNSTQSGLKDTEFPRYMQLYHPILLDTQQESSGILDLVLHTHQEGHRLSAVDQTVIVGQGQVHHGSSLDLAVLGDHGSHLGGVHAQDGALRGVDDGRAEKGAEHTAVGYREGTYGCVCKTKNMKKKNEKLIR